MKGVGTVMDKEKLRGILASAMEESPTLRLLRDDPESLGERRGLSPQLVEALKSPNLTLTLHHGPALTRADMASPTAEEDSLGGDAGTPDAGTPSLPELPTLPPVGLPLLPPDDGPQLHTDDRTPEEQARSGGLPKGETGGEETPHTEIEWFENDRDFRGQGRRGSQEWEQLEPPVGD